MTKLRLIAVARAVVAFAVATGAWFIGAWGLTLLAALIGTIVLVGGLGWPVEMDRVIRRITAGVGKVVGAVLLTGLYWTFFLIFGKLGRQGSRDRLGRSFEPGRDSYWIERGPAPRGSRKNLS